MKRLWLAFLACVLALPGLVGVSTPPAEAVTSEPYLVGRGIADITGEAAETGMMGDGSFTQTTTGITARQHARAFVIVDRATGQRVLMIVADICMPFESVHQGVLARLKARYGDLYGYANVVIVGTHTHSGPGGYSHHLLYNITTKGFHPDTYAAVVDGIVEAADRAIADMKPGSLRLSQGQLHNASVNRSAVAFDKNSTDIRSYFPERIDPLMTDLIFAQNGTTTGVLNVFGTHGTSLSNTNTLISGDNKGYAAWRWEKQQGMDYLDAANAPFIAAFAQSNTGDMSPNLALTPPTPETEDSNTAVIGERQFAKARDLASSGAQITGPVDARLVYMDFDNQVVQPEYTRDGRTHSTCRAVAGASMAAGSIEDAPAGPGFFEGFNNPFFDRTSPAAYRVSPALADCQAPKSMLLDANVLNQTWPWLQTRLPVQLIRIGQLYLLSYPGEVTIGAGYRLRERVAGIVGQPLDNVIMMSYANAYSHYLTTPEEYDTQQYEGGSTLFGRWQQPAVEQTYARLATSMTQGTSLPMGTPPADLASYQLMRQTGVVLDTAGVGRSFGMQIMRPADSYSPGQTASVTFVGAHPNNNLKRGGTYTQVQRLVDGAWVRVADDNDFTTSFVWKRVGISQSDVTLEWRISAGTPAGTYRFVYSGDYKVAGTITGFTGVSSTFTVG